MVRFSRQTIATTRSQPACILIVLRYPNNIASNITLPPTTHSIFQYAHFSRSAGHAGNFIARASRAAISANRDAVHVPRASAETGSFVPRHRRCCGETPDPRLAALQYQYGGILQSPQRLPLKTVTGMIRQKAPRGSFGWLGAGCQRERRTGITSKNTGAGSRAVCRQPPRTNRAKGNQATPQTLSATDKNKGFGKGASDEIWASEKA